MDAQTPENQCSMPKFYPGQEVIGVYKSIIVFDKIRSVEIKDGVFYYKLNASDKTLFPESCLYPPSEKEEALKTWEDQAERRSQRQKGLF